MLVTATGWTPTVILDELTWQDVHDLTIYWRNHPPVQWMVQAFLGIKDKGSEQKLASITQLPGFENGSQR